ncbi:MAG: hypothetical protein WB853_00640, partial [Desulfobacterales bacterium]
LNGPSPPEMMPPASAQWSEFSCGAVAYLTGKTFSNVFNRPTNKEREIVPIFDANPSDRFETKPVELRSRLGEHRANQF